MAYGITTNLLAQWNAAYAWGDHASAGYLTTETDAAGVKPEQPAQPIKTDAEAAAAAVLQGWERGRFHIHFPRRFTNVLLGLRLLPYRAYFAAVRRFTGL